jgi:hypothetical protein
LLRASPGKEMPFLQDHSGARHRHGSPNEDRQWNLAETDKDIERRTIKAWKNGEAPEPIRCPNCGLERRFGDTCPHCRYRHKRSVRMIRMITGKLVQYQGPMVKKRKKVSSDQQAWTGCLYAAAYSKSGMNLRQAAGYYYKTTGKWPDQLLKPTPPQDGSSEWSLAVKDLYPWLLKRRRKMGA